MEPAIRGPVLLADNGNAAQMDYRSRMSVMPLGAAIYVRKDWN